MASTHLYFWNLRVLNPNKLSLLDSPLGIFETARKFKKKTCPFFITSASRSAARLGERRIRASVRLTANLPEIRTLLVIEGDIRLFV